MSQDILVVLQVLEYNLHSLNLQSCGDSYTERKIWIIRLGYLLKILNPNLNIRRTLALIPRRKSFTVFRLEERINQDLLGCTLS